MSFPTLASCRWNTFIVITKFVLNGLSKVTENHSLQMLPYNEASVYFFFLFTLRPILNTMLQHLKYITVFLLDWFHEGSYWHEYNECRLIHIIIRAWFCISLILQYKKLSAINPCQLQIGKEKAFYINRKFVAFIVFILMKFFLSIIFLDNIEQHRLNWTW